METKKGIFITFEGSDGSGKSTQIKMLEDYLISMGMDVVLTREPGGTRIGESIRNIILDRGNAEMDPMAEAFLYAASRAQHVSQVIKPALASGKIVICDRFVDSSIAYQGFGRGLGRAVSVINEYAVAGAVPDITFLMKIDPKISKGRIREEDEDRLEHEKLEFHERVYAGYVELERSEPRIVGIDATREIEEISKSIISEAEKLLKKRGISNDIR